MVALRGDRGPGCATCSPSQIDVVLYPGSDRVSECLHCTGIMSRCVGIALPPISLHCRGVILVEACGHRRPHFLVLYRYYSRRGTRAQPPPTPIFVGGPGCVWDCVLSLHVVGYPEESIIILRLVVAASSRLTLFSVGVGLMSVLSMLSPLSTERP